MKKLYGILGTGTAPKKVIHTALDDLPQKATYVVPWYGKPTEGLEHVYDWMLDNEVSFNLVATKQSKIPTALTKQAEDVQNVDDVDAYIIDTLRYSDVVGDALLLWDDDAEKRAEQCIDAGLKTLELSNGLVPIIFDESPVVESVVEETEEEDPTDDESFDRPTLENMPAAVVKRMARDKGTEVKTKEEAISAILGEEPKPPVKPDRHIVSVTVRYSDGMVMEL